MKYNPLWCRQVAHKRQRGVTLAKIALWYGCGREKIDKALYEHEINRQGNVIKGYAFLSTVLFITLVVISLIN